MNQKNQTREFLGVSEERGDIIENYVTSISQSHHNDAERVEKIGEAFPRIEERLYAVYLTVPTQG